MRARLAILASGQRCEIREIVLQDKAPEFLATSKKATVPVLVLPNGQVLEESLDVMRWALSQADPDHWLSPQEGSLEEMLTLIERTETEFKHNLDRYKYSNRYHNIDPNQQRDAACRFLYELDQQLKPHGYLFGSRIALADVAIAPFVRQFANVDRVWFDQCDFNSLHHWLGRIVGSDRFAAIMQKYPKWKSGDLATHFPTDSSDKPFSCP